MEVPQVTVDSVEDVAETIRRFAIIGDPVKYSGTDKIPDRVFVDLTSVNVHLHAIGHLYSTNTRRTIRMIIENSTIYLPLLDSLVLSQNDLYSLRPDRA